MERQGTLFINGTFYTGKKIVRNGQMRIDADGAIVSVDSSSAPEGGDGAVTVVDLGGQTVLPGLIDVHVHGGDGWDLIRGEPDDFAGTAQFHASHGTTALLATTGGAPEPHTAAMLRNARRAAEDRYIGGADIIGVHLEGPFINPLRKGAFEESWLHPPDHGEMDRYIEASGGTIRLITMAPELSGGEAFVRRLASQGIRVSIGHSDATYEQTVEAVEWGVRHTTHHFNGMRPLHHRDPGVAGAGIMLPSLTTELITDGVHVHPAAVRFLFDVKGSWNVCVITDAVRQAGMPDGDYGGTVVTGGEIYLKGTRTLAGSSSTMLKSLHRVLEYTGRPLENVLPSFTAVPAREAGIESRKGTLEPGKDADFVILDEQLDLLQTFVRGVCVYQKEK